MPTLFLDIDAPGQTIYLQIFNQLPMDDFDLDPWLDEISSLYRKADPAHDFSHILRICKMARKIGREERADMKVLLPAALLHDLGSKKGHESGQEQSGQAGLGAARSFLEGKGLDRDRIERVLYAVEVHRFSRGFSPPVTLEARILQDADRLDAMGAIGIALLFVTGGADVPSSRSLPPGEGARRRKMESGPLL